MASESDQEPDERGTIIHVRQHAGRRLERERGIAAIGVAKAGRAMLRTRRPGGPIPPVTPIADGAIDGDPARAA
jgi:hypothetical protein